MKITAVMIVFNGDHVLECSLKSIYEHVEEILIAEGPVKYWQDQGYSSSTDKTIEILKTFRDPQNKIKKLFSKYEEKNQQFQCALDLMTKKTDYILQIDADEVWEHSSIENLKRLLNERKPISVGVYSHTFVGCNKGFDRVMSGFEEKTDNFLRVFKFHDGCKFETHRPPTILYPDGKRSGSGKEHIDSDEAFDYYGVSMCHYSYVWPSQVKSKIDYYKAKISMNSCIDDFYKLYWLPWAKSKTIDQKWEIEKTILGMHEFKPEIRGPAFTKPFTGKHPTQILLNELRLVQRFNDEIKCEQYK